MGPQRPIRILHQNSCTLNIANYVCVILTFAWAHVCVNTSQTERAVLVAMSLNFSGRFGQIIWLENQNSFIFF